MRASMCASACPSRRIRSRTICRSVFPSNQYDSGPVAPNTSVSATWIARRPAPSVHRMVPSMSKSTRVCGADGGTAEWPEGGAGGRRLTPREHDVDHDGEGAGRLHGRGHLAEGEPGDQEGDERLQVAVERRAGGADDAHAAVPDEVRDHERREAAVGHRPPTARGHRRPGYRAE